MRLTYDNKHLFSVGGDGMLCVFDVREGARGAPKLESDLRFSNEILTENTEMEKYQSEKAGLDQELKNHQEANQ